MKVNQKVISKHSKESGVIISIEHVEGLSSEYTVKMDTGEEMIFYGAELEVLDV
tara:strand:- start:964 stop:1125 length:162 start_codon:yes stop_codon:yes gene_type:complete